MTDLARRIGGEKAIQAAQYATTATKNADSTKVVLGRFSEGGISYVDVADDLDATYFQLDNWDEVTTTFGNDNMWYINEQFLNQQWGAGKEFFFSHNPWQAAAGSFFEKEVLHLMDIGVTDFIQVGENLWKAVR